VSASIKARTLWQLLLPRRRLCSPFRCSLRDGLICARRPLFIVRQMATLPVADELETLTFIAGLQCDALTAAFVIDTPMDPRIFETYVETQLALARHR
jgi:hypothetical protein